MIRPLVAADTAAASRAAVRTGSAGSPHRNPRTGAQEYALFWLNPWYTRKFFQYRRHTRRSVTTKRIYDWP